MSTDLLRVDGVDSVPGNISTAPQRSLADSCIPEVGKGSEFDDRASACRINEDDRRALG
jgi:hypothetical protein